MPDEIAILRATGHEDAAKILEALRAEQTAALPPAAPAAPAAPVEERSGPTLAEIDKMTVNEIAKLDTKIVDAALAEVGGS
jgi:hypothetical protein